jgi:Tubulin like
MSPTYAAPEMFSGKFSSYSDQYGLAIVYQEMLTGTRPFRGRTAAQLSEQHLRAYPTLSALAVPDQAIVGRALSKNPNDRFPSCGEMVRALTGVAANGSRTSGGDGDRAFDGEKSFGRSEDARDGFPLLIQSCFRADIPDEPLPPSSESSESATSVVMEHAGPRSDLLQDSLREPSLFVGVGGLAGCVLSQIKRLFESRSRQDGVKNPLGWLALDTDRAAILQLRSTELPGSLEVEETVLMPLHDPDHYRPQLKQLLGWLGRHWLFRIPRSQCVDGIRALGRLALIDNAEEVMTRLRQAVKHVESLIENEAQRERFQVVVFASISGGTGGGCLADLGFAIRRILREEGLEGVSVSCVLIQAASARKERKELAHANAYVTLSELNSFLDSDSRSPEIKAVGLSPTDSGAPLFDEVILADFGDLAVDADRDTRAHLLAEYAYLRRATPCGRLPTEPRTDSAKPHDLARLRHFRLARVGFPRSELERVITREVCLRMIRRWLHGTPSPTVAAVMPSSFQAHQSPAASSGPADGDLEMEDSSPLMVLDEAKFSEAFLERLERASGSNPLKFLQTKIRDLLQHRGREELSQGLRRFYDEVDEQFGPGSGKPPTHAQASLFQKKLRDEFKHDRLELEQALESWIFSIVEEPGARLSTASDRLHRLTQELVAQVDASAAQIHKLQVQKTEIRDRHLGDCGAGKASLPMLLKPLHRELTPQANEICNYGQVSMHQAAMLIRAEIMTALIDKGRRLEEKLDQLRRSVESVGRLFLVKDTAFRNSQCLSLGRSVEFFTGGTVGLSQLRTTLTDSFCTEQQLAIIEHEFQEQVLEAHGGLVAVMEGDSRFLNRLFDDDLFHRVAHLVGQWLAGWDAASILLHRRGSIKGAVDELIAFWNTTRPEVTGCPDQRVILALPSSPSGRSLGESLAKSPAAAFITDYVAIPDDIVLCVEPQDMSFSSVAAGMVFTHPWIAELAPKLVSRKDVAWADLFGTEGVECGVRGEDVS